MVTLGEVLSLAIPRFATMASPKLGNCDFYESLDCWNICGNYLP